MEVWEGLSTPSADLARAGRRYLILCRALCEQSPDPLRWHMYPIHHVVVHLIEAAMVNPRDEWNYGDESEIGDAVKLARRSSARHMATALIERYRATFVL